MFVDSYVEPWTVNLSETNSNNIQTYDGNKSITVSNSLTARISFLKQCGYPRQFWSVKYVNGIWLGVSDLPRVLLYAWSPAQPGTAECPGLRSEDGWRRWQHGRPEL